MDAKEILAQAHDVGAIQRVFGEPIEREGATVVPVATIWCFGLVARPVGVFRIKGGEMEWQPAVDATVLALGGQFVGVVALLVLRSLLKRRRGRWGRHRGTGTITTATTATVGGVVGRIAATSDAPRDQPPSSSSSGGGASIALRPHSAACPDQ